MSALLGVDHVSEHNDADRVSNDGSRTSDDADPECPICLVTLLDQAVGTPESCDHSFCLTCIQEWAKVSTKNGWGRTRYFPMRTATIVLSGGRSSEVGCSIAL